MEFLYIFRQLRSWKGWRILLYFLPTVRCFIVWQIVNWGAGVLKKDILLGLCLCKSSSTAPKNNSQAFQDSWIAIAIFIVSMTSANRKASSGFALLCNGQFWHFCSSPWRMACKTTFTTTFAAAVDMKYIRYMTCIPKLDFSKNQFWTTYFKSKETIYLSLEKWRNKMNG